MPIRNYRHYGGATPAAEASKMFYTCYRIALCHLLGRKKNTTTVAAPQSASANRRNCTSVTVYAGRFTENALRENARHEPAGACSRTYRSFVLGDRLTIYKVHKRKQKNAVKRAPDIERH